MVSRLLPPLALAVILVGAGTTAARADSRLLGLNVHQSADVGVPVTQACKGQIVRVDFNWYAAEATQGTYDWSVLDTVVTAATAKGLTVLATTGYTPTWAAGGAANPTNNAVPIAGSYAAFVTAAVQHYAGRITYWELWNEPNITGFFSGTAQQYVDSVLVPGAAAVHAACTTCKVVGPAIATVGSNYADWMQTVLTSARSSLDIVSGHDYAVFDDMGGGGTSPDFFSKLDKHRIVKVGTTVVYEDPLSLRESMNASGAAAMPLWITETGYQATYGDATAMATQARYATEVLSAMVPRPWWTATVFYEAFDVQGQPYHWGFSLADPDASTGYDLKPVCSVLSTPPDWDAGLPDAGDGGSEDGGSSGADATAGDLTDAGDAGEAQASSGSTGSSSGCAVAAPGGRSDATLAMALMWIGVAVRRKRSG